MPLKKRNRDSNSIDDDDDALLESKICTLLLQLPSSPNSRNQYAMERELVALLLMTRLQDSARLTTIWQTYHPVLVPTCQSLLLLKTIPKNETQTAMNETEKALQTCYLRLVAQLACRWDTTTTATTAEAQDTKHHVVMVLSNLLLHALRNRNRANNNKNARMMETVDLEIVASALPITLEILTMMLQQQQQQQPLVTTTSEATLTLMTATSCLTDMNGILSNLWEIYHDSLTCQSSVGEDASLDSSSLSETTTTTTTTTMRQAVLTDDEMKEDPQMIMLQTFTTLLDASSPLTTTKDNNNNLAVAWHEACWQLFTCQGPTIAQESLPAFWLPVLAWWTNNNRSIGGGGGDQKNNKGPSSNNQPQQGTATLLYDTCNKGLWAEALLLPIVQGAGARAQLKDILMQNAAIVVADDESKTTTVAGQLAKLLMACAVSAQKSSSLRLSSSSQQPTPTTDRLRPLAWTCATSLIDEAGWVWLLDEDHSESFSHRRHDRLVTLLRLAVGEWKIQLGWFLARDNNSTTAPYNETMEDALILTQACGRLIVQAVEFIVQLSEKATSEESCNDGKQIMAPLSGSAVGRLRKSLEEALDAVVQYLEVAEHRFVDVDASVIRVLGTILTELDAFDAQQRPNIAEDDDDGNDENVVLYTLHKAMALATAEVRDALLPALANVYASAEGDEQRIELLEKYELLGKASAQFFESFWEETNNTDSVPWACQAMELYCALPLGVTDAKVVVDSDISATLRTCIVRWMSRILEQYTEAQASATRRSAASGSMMLVQALSASVACYHEIDKDSQPNDTDASIIRKALDLCAFVQEAN